MPFLDDASRGPTSKGPHDCVMPTAKGPHQTHQHFLALREHGNVGIVHIVDYYCRYGHILFYVGV